MRRAQFVGISALGLFLLAGCQTVKFVITAEPEDSQIYVDGKHIGEGTATFQDDRHYQNGVPNQYSVTITRPGFQTLHTVIKNQLNFGLALGDVVLGIGGNAAAIAYGSYEAATQPQSTSAILTPLYLLLGLTDVLAAEFGASSAFFFDKEYDFALTKNQ